MFFMIYRSQLASFPARARTRTRTNTNPNGTEPMLRAEVYARAGGTCALDRRVQRVAERSCSSAVIRGPEWPSTNELWYSRIPMRLSQPIGRVQNLRTAPRANELAHMKRQLFVFTPRARWYWNKRSLMMGGWRYAELV